MNSTLYMLSSSPEVEFQREKRKNGGEYRGRCGGERDFYLCKHEETLYLNNLATCDEEAM